VPKYGASIAHFAREYFIAGWEVRFGGHLSRNMVQVSLILRSNFFISVFLLVDVLGEVIARLVLLLYMVGPKGIAITLWETEADLQTSESGYYQEQLVKASHLLAGSSVRERYEVAVQDM